MDPSEHLPAAATIMDGQSIIYEPVILPWLVFNVFISEMAWFLDTDPHVPSLPLRSL